MKKFLLLFSVAVCSFGVAQAQDSPHDNHDGHNHATTDAPKETSSLTVENMAFATEIHDFGTIPEGPAAEFEFKFTNTGKEPINLSQVRASCGCTTPSWSKDPVLPGKTGIVKASYNTDHRPGPFTKSITVMSDAGTKVLTIKGNVEKAPTGSVPTAAKSMIQK